jgi:hypothetical protein
MGFVAAPAGWHGGASQELVEQSGRQGHFGGVHGVIEAERWDAPKPGVVLYVTKVSANTASPSDAATAEIASLGSGAGEPETKDKQLDLQASMIGSDAGHNSRMIIASTADRIVAVKGECYMAADASAPDVNQCVQALATLDTGIAVKDRVDLTISHVPPVPALSGSALTDTHVSLPPMQVHQDAQGPDRRPVYVGAGLIVIAAIFWWNRKRAAHDR